MAKETFYFSHDYNARTDDRIKPLMRKHGITGYGLYWCIVEDLYNNANALRLDYEGIAYDLRTDAKLVESVLTEFDLFSIKNGYFSSESVKKRLEERARKSENAQKSAKIRWNHANALPTHSDRNAIKDSKGKEIKEIKEKIVVENSNYHDLIYKLYQMFFNQEPKMADYMVIEKEAIDPQFTFETMKEIMHNTIRDVAAGDKQKQNARYISAVIRGKKSDIIKNREIENNRKIKDAKYEELQKEYEERRIRILQEQQQELTKVEEKPKKRILTPEEKELRKKQFDRLVMMEN